MIVAPLWIVLAAASPVASELTWDRDFEVTPRAAGWMDVVGRAFDPRWRLSAVPEGQPDLLAELEGLLALRFELIHKGEVYRNLGDIFVAASTRDPAKRERWMKRLRDHAPTELRQRWKLVRELLLDAALQSRGWDPEEDDGDDGILAWESWRPDEAVLERAPWSRVDAGVRIEQAAALVAADLATIKAVENDYRAYPSNAGAGYDWIYPVRQSYLRGSDEKIGPFAAVRMRFRCDLPFPFSGYTCDLRVLNSLDEEGRLATDIYSASDDFHYMVGRDVFLPVETSTGDRVGYLLVRWFGFDLDDVPDRASHRREALRTSLGNLKRRAERGFEGQIEEDTPGVVPEFRVLGTR